MAAQHGYAVKDGGLQRDSSLDAPDSRQTSVHVAIGGAGLSLGSAAL
jgi:hypothetical protein